MELPWEFLNPSRECCECSWFCASVAIPRKQNEVGFNTVKHVIHVIITKTWPCYNLVTYFGTYLGRYISTSIIIYLYMYYITPVDFFCDLCCKSIWSPKIPRGNPWGKIPRGPKRLGRCWTLQWATHLPHPSCEIQKAMKVLKIRNRGGRKNGRRGDMFSVVVSSKCQLLNVIMYNYVTMLNVGKYSIHGNVSFMAKAAKNPF